MKLIVAVFTILVCYLSLDAEGNVFDDTTVPNTDIVTIIRGILKEQALMKKRENETKKEIEVLKKREDETKIKMMDMKKEIEFLKKNASVDISAGGY